MTEQNVDSYSIEIPKHDSRHFLVNFPGYIRNEEKALATFGGLDGISRQRESHPKYLQLSLRPSDPYAHPITSNESRPRKAIILKITRKRQDPSSSNDHNNITVDALALTNCSYTFTTPADIQYVGRDRRPLEDQWSSQPERDDFIPDGIPTQPLLSAPSTFLVESSIDYSFKQYKAIDHGIDSLGRKPKGPRTAAMIDFFSKTIPQAVQHDALTAHTAGADRQLSDASKSHLSRLELLFSKRPVFVEHALTAAMAGIALEGGTMVAEGLIPVPGFPSTKLHIELLTKVSYRFKNGPWRGAWIRKGYDPRNIPEARKYQVVEYVLPSDWYANLTNNNATTTNTSMTSTSNTVAEQYTSLCAFQSTPMTISTVLQLCDVDDIEIQTLIQSSPLPTTTNTNTNNDTTMDTTDNNNVVSARATDGSGWFDQSTWERIKARIAERFAFALQIQQPSAMEHRMESEKERKNIHDDGVQPMNIDDNNIADTTTTTNAVAATTALQPQAMDTTTTTTNATTTNATNATTTNATTTPVTIDDVLSTELMKKIKHALQYGIGGGGAKTTSTGNKSNMAMNTTTDNTTTDNTAVTTTTTGGNGGAAINGTTTTNAAVMMTTDATMNNSNTTVGNNVDGIATTTPTTTTTTATAPIAATTTTTTTITNINNRKEDMMMQPPVPQPSQHQHSDEDVSDEIEDDDDDDDEEEYDDDEDDYDDDDEDDE